MKPWSQRIRNLTLLGVLLAGTICIAGVFTTSWMEHSVADISQQQGATLKQEIIPLDSVSGSAAEMERRRVEERERPVDVF